jgi:ABC-type uncharacterized transport system auxiliary subunit
MITIAGARALALLALPLIAGGCAGSLFKTQLAPPTLYLLSAESPTEDRGAAQLGDAKAGAPGSAAPGSAARTNLAVLKPRVRTGLDTERIAALYPDRRLDYFADARWSGPLDKVIEDLAVQLLRSRSRLANVSADASAFASPYWLEIEVEDFQAEYAAEAATGGDAAANTAPGAAAPPTVHVHFLARIGSSGDGTIIARCEGQAREPASSNRMSAIVAAYNGAANQALQQIAATCTATLMPATSNAR